MKKGKNIFVQLLMMIAAVILTGCGGKEQESITPVVQITSNGITGSGILFELREDSLVLVTAAHVLQAATDKVEVVFGDGYVAESADYALSQTSDIAFIRISREGLSKKQQESYLPVTVDKKGFDMLREGAAVTLLGIPADGEVLKLDATLMYPWIFAEDFNQYMMLISGEILPGMSGGGVFDGEGNLIGVLCGVSENREIAAVPLSIIFAELRKLLE